MWNSGAQLEAAVYRRRFVGDSYVQNLRQGGQRRLDSGDLASEDIFGSGRL
jgi:hypothetical protein